MKRALFLFIAGLIACGGLKDAQPSDTTAATPDGGTPVLDSGAKDGGTTPIVTNEAGTTTVSNNVVNGLTKGNLLAVDDANLYFNDGANLFTCPKNDCSSPSPILDTAVSTTDALFATGGLVYWVDAVQGTALSCTSDCGAPVTFLPSPARIHALASDGDSMFWVDGDTLWTCERAACSGSGKSLSPGGILAAQLTATQGTVLWYSADKEAIEEGSRAFAPQTFAPADATDVFATGSAVYWVEDGTSVRFCQLSGCDSPSQLASGDDLHTPISDGLIVAWRDGLQIRWCTPNNCLGTMKTVVTTEIFDGSARLAMDAQYIYWASRTGIGKVAR